MAVLRIERGKDRGRAVPLEPGRPVVVGREQRNELAVKDHMASRRHCEVHVGPGGKVLVKDLRSSNGTYLNGRRLPPEVDTPLEIEDKLQVGETLMALLSDAAGKSHGKEGELTGKTLGGYRVMERIGRGGMGTVYKALQISLERQVALKVLARDLAEDPARKELFASEARAAGKLNHPNIVQVYDVGQEDGLHFYSMEFMERGSLEETLEREGKLLVPRALEVAIDAARGLAYAERARIVHRDVKPGNLMVNAEGVCKLGDLGIARAHDAGSTTVGQKAVEEGEKAAPAKAQTEKTAPEKTAAEETDRADGDELITGSPAYMAPEQAESPRSVDHKADLYSLGATLFHLLSGEPPFSAPSPREVIVKHRTEPPRALSSVDPAIPEDVSALVLHLLEKRPEDGIESAARLEEELRRLSARYPLGWNPGDPPAVAGPGDAPAEAPPAAPISKPLVAAAIVLLALPFVLGGAYLVKRRLDQAEQDRRAEAEERTRLQEVRRAAERAEREAQAQADAKRREAEAEKARGEADLYLAGHAEDLAAAKARYEDVAARYAGTGAARRALEQAQGIDRSMAEIAAAKGGRAAREAEAAAELGPLAEAAEKGPLSDAELLRRRLDELAKKWKGTEVAEKAAPAAKKALADRIDAIQRAAQHDFDAAIASDDLDRAKAAIDSVAASGALDLQGFVEERRKALAAAVRAKNAFQEALAKKAAADEAALVEAALDKDRRAKLLFEEMAQELRGLLSGRLKTEEGRTRAAFELRVLEAEERLRAHFFEHVNKGGRPALTFPVAKGIDGTAVKAEPSGLTFQAKEGGGAIEVKRAFPSLARDDVLRFLAMVPALTPLERCGLAALFLDDKDPDRARKELERAAKDAEKSADAPAKALADELSKLAGPQPAPGGAK